jgi:MHS family citrate/tricarballylate:H+ symporter-like MFS transporter
MFAALLGIIAASTVYRGGKAVPAYDAVPEPVAGR